MIMLCTSFYFAIASLFNSTSTEISSEEQITAFVEDIDFDFPSLEEGSQIKR
jgi:hypothetical protein